MSVFGVAVATNRNRPPGVTDRLSARISRDFGAMAQQVIDDLRGAEPGVLDSERVVAAIILIAEGDRERLQRAIALSRIDWRDVLMGGGLGNEDWPEKLDQALGAA